MSKLRALTLSPFLVFCALLTINAQTMLQIGTPIARSLGPGQVDEFTVSLEENNFIQFVVEQRGIDLFVKVSAPGGMNLGEYDTPNGPDGPEHVSFVASVAGIYRIRISPLDPDGQTTGRYEIKVLDIRAATDQELKANKNLEEVRAKGIALLGDIETTIQELKSLPSRIQAQLETAELLWEIDEKRAAKFMSNAIAGIKELLATADAGNEQLAAQYHLILQLRNDVGRVLAERDPDAALNFLQSTTQRYSPYSTSRELLMQERELELSIANQIAKKDPNRAVQIARRSLKQGYSYNLVSIVSQLAQNNPEVAKELVHEIGGKLLDEEKLIQNSDAANLAVSLLRSYHTPEGSVQFITSRMMSPFRSGLLSEDQYKQLLQKVLGEVLSYKQPRNFSHSPDALWNLIPGLQALGAGLDQAISGSKAALEKKIAELGGASNMIVNPAQEYLLAQSSNVTFLQS